MRSPSGHQAGWRSHRSTVAAAYRSGSEDSETAATARWLPAVNRKRRTRIAGAATEPLSHHQLGTTRRARVMPSTRSKASSKLSVNRRLPTARVIRPLLDQKRAVARQPGHHRAARLEHAVHVVQPPHEKAAFDALHELVGAFGICRRRRRAPRPQGRLRRSCSPGLALPVD